MWLRWLITLKRVKTSDRKFAKNEWPAMFCMIHCWPVNKFIKDISETGEKRVGGKEYNVFLSYLPISINRMASRGGIPAALKVKINAEFPLLKVTSATCSVCLLFPKLSFCSEILCYPPVTFSCMRSTEVWVYCFTTRELILQQLLIYWGHSRSAMWVLWGAFFLEYGQSGVLEFL